MRAMACLRLALTALLFVLSSAPARATVSGPTGIAIDDYTLISSTRISRTVYEYIYTADASNWGTGDVALSAALASTASNITVVQGSLDFGDVPEGATRQSVGSFVVRVDRTLPFDVNALLWTVTATPLAPSTYALIDAAVTNGTLDAETGLAYKVYYEFGDPRLPAQYLGRDDGRRESTGIQQALAGFATLSAPTQALLRPFLLPPTDPASWYQLHLSQQSGAGQAAPAAVHAAGNRAVMAATGFAGATASGASASAAAGTTCAPSSFGLEGAILTSNGKVCVHFWTAAAYPSGGASDADLLGEAQGLAFEIDTKIWPTLTALLGNPPVGADGLLHVYLQAGASVTLAAGADALGVTFNVACGPTANPIVYLAHGLANPFATAAHEITHAILDGVATSDSCATNDWSWLQEVSATWAMHFVYPPKNSGGEQDYARSFLKVPELPLETLGNLHEYGSYLLFLYMTRGDASSQPNANTNKVPLVWNAYTSFDLLHALDFVIGGLDTKFHDFALYNWNRQQQGCGGTPYAYYARWDCLKDMVRESSGASPIAVDLKGSVAAVYPLPHLINHLAAKYWHFDFTHDSTIRRVRLVQPYYQNNASGFVKVQAIIKLHSGGWQPAVDWTGYDHKTLCRDKPQENVDELVIVISQSNFEDRNASVSDTGAGAAIATKLQVSALGCSNWTGTVNFRFQHSAFEDVIETATATGVTWTLQTDSWDDTVNTQLYTLTGGSVAWTHTGSIASLGCSGSSSGSFPATGVTASAKLQLGLKAIPVYDAQGQQTDTYFGGPVTFPDNYTCTLPPYSFPPVTAGLYADWLETSDGTHYPVIYRSSGGTPNALSDSYHSVTPGTNDTYDWNWTFTRSSTFPYQ